MESKATILKGVSMSEIDRRNMLIGGATAGAGSFISTTAKAEEKLTVWQPIETAPKDRTKVILYIPPYEYLYTGKYFDKQWSIDQWHTGRGDNPTHWMPFPDPPQ